MRSSLWFVGSQCLPDDLAHLLLLLVDFQRSVNDSQAEFLHDLVVFIQHSRLENLEALHHVRAQPEVHPGLVVLQLGAGPGQQAGEGHLDRHAEVQGEVRLYGEAVQAAHPALGDAAHGIPGEGGVHVPVC